MLPQHEDRLGQFLRVVHSTNQKQTVRVHSFRTHFLARSGETLVPVAVEDVAYFSACDKWTYLVSNQGRQYLIDGNLKLLEEELDSRMFFRLNRKYLVKLSAIKCLYPYFKGQVTVKIQPEPNDKIVVSRKKTPELKQWITH